MDDVDAELDRKRIGRLLEYLEGRTQTFLTTSKETIVKQFAERANVYEVSEGKVVAGDKHATHISTTTATG